VATFDEIKAALDRAQQRMQQEIQQNPQQRQQVQDTQIKITPTVRVIPGGTGRLILDQPTNETKVQMDMDMQATATGAGAPPPGQPNSASITYTMDMDTFVAPGIPEYQEFARFYRRMALEVSWMKVPAMNVQIDPRVTQGMSELQRNSDALKGFPLLSYVSMTMVAAADGQPVSQSGPQNQPPSNPPPSRSSNSSDNSIPENPSAAVMRGLGGLFGKKKQDSSSASSNQAGAPPPNPNSNPNAMIEMTTQVISFSGSSLDGGLFEIPAGYTQVQEDPSQVFGGGPSQQQQQPPKK
jgi:hypothetical protein